MVRNLVVLILLISFSCKKKQVEPCVMASLQTTVILHETPIKDATTSTISTVKVCPGDELFKELTKKKYLVIVENGKLRCVIYHYTIKEKD
jgi:hypothetical protein